MSQRRPKQTVEHLLRTLPDENHDDLIQLLLATENAKEILAELERANAIILNMVRYLSAKSKKELRHWHSEYNLIGSDGGIFRTHDREALIARSRCIHGDAK